MSENVQEESVEKKRMAEIAKLTPADLHRMEDLDHCGFSYVGNPPVKFGYLKENFFVNRKPKKVSHSDAMICCCSPGDACGDDCLNRLMMIECGARTCPAKHSCTNQNFQQRRYANLIVTEEPNKGWGLRTLARIRAGTFVIEYCGDIINHAEFQRRAHMRSADSADHFYFMSIANEEVIDASMKGNESRFINHSCGPNCETQKWSVNGEMRVGLFATVDIPAGSELTFDYKYERYGAEAQKCYCGAPSCRGVIGGTKQVALREVSGPQRVAAEKGAKARRRKGEEYEEELYLDQIFDSQQGLASSDQARVFSKRMLRVGDLDLRTKSSMLSTLEKSAPAILADFVLQGSLRMIKLWIVALMDIIEPQAVKADDSPEESQPVNGRDSIVPMAVDEIPANGGDNDVHMADAGPEPAEASVEPVAGTAEHVDSAAEPIVSTAEPVANDVLPADSTVPADTANAAEVIERSSVEAAAEAAAEAMLKQQQRDEAINLVVRLLKLCKMLKPPTFVPLKPVQIYTLLKERLLVCSVPEITAVAQEYYAVIKEFEFFCTFSIKRDPAAIVPHSEAPQPKATDSPKVESGARTPVSADRKNKQPWYLTALGQSKKPKPDSPQIAARTNSSATLTSPAGPAGSATTPAATTTPVAAPFTFQDLQKHSQERDSSLYSTNSNSLGPISFPSSDFSQPTISSEISHAEAEQELFDIPDERKAAFVKAVAAKLNGLLYPYLKQGAIADKEGFKDLMRKLTHKVRDTEEKRHDRLVQDYVLASGADRVKLMEQGAKAYNFEHGTRGKKIESLVHEYFKKLQGKPYQAKPKRSR
eukprot:TRINITY_DN104_c0_g1_i1.p1 TRINITY_DN104_c0_g1~~TRINITY_DN104_c0_g1_i1.p1  ORF type:complete len:819 (+),score=188.65 TRINITY_DN104_c0_g1_i1:65-2521(+)